MSPEKKATINAFGKAIAQKLADIRDQKGVTQTQLAEATGISQSQLSKQLRGIRAINMDELDSICKALGTTMVEVIRSVEAPDDLASRRRVQADDYDDGTVQEWDDTIPHAADSSDDEDAIRYERGEDPID